MIKAKADLGIALVLVLLCQAGTLCSCCCWGETKTVHSNLCQSDASLLYCMCLNLMGTMQVPRVELAEMGPALDMALGRFKEASAELRKEAHKRHKPTAKKVCLFLLKPYGQFWGFFFCWHDHITSFELAAHSDFGSGFVVHDWHGEWKL